MTPGILELALILLLATVFGIAARLLRQPLALAYMLTGLAIGVVGYFHLIDRELFATLSDLGIMLLLFLIGLEINYTSLRLVGKPALVLGAVEVAITLSAGFALARILHFSSLEAAYLAAAFTFSSTVIVIKLLSEKKDLGSLYGKLSVGILLVQDVIAIFLLFALAELRLEPRATVVEFLVIAAKIALLIGGTFWLGRKILPVLFRRIAQSPELLFLASMAWCLGIAALAARIGFPVAIGGFLAGLALANTSEHFQIAGRIKPLRDFFLLIFFVALGSSLGIANLSNLTIPLLIFSLFILVGNPLIVLIVMGLWGYRKRTSFLCGITTAQISEFSFILAALGLKLGHLQEGTASLITGVGIITITASSYLILHSETIFRFLAPLLGIFERKKHLDEIWDGPPPGKRIILIGAHRVGQNILAHLPKEDTLIIDFDPNIVRDLRRGGYATLFGDISDEEIFEKANISDASLIISTSPDFEDNARLLETTGRIAQKPTVILRAEDEKDAEYFYARGAAYVLVPHLTSSQYLGRSIAVDADLRILEQLRERDRAWIRRAAIH